MMASWTNTCSKMGPSSEKKSAKNRRMSGTTSFEPIDKGILYALKDLQIEGEPDFLQQVVLTYLDCSQPLIGKLEAEFSKKDTQGMHDIAHRLKSSSASVGAMRLSEFSRMLEMDCKHNFGENAALMVAAVVSEFASVKKALEREIGTA